ncbi:MAG: DNA repair protein RecN, partial [Alphaproteobacteria bacterium]
MLTALSIRDIVLIDRLDLEFGPGLSVMTGETGAGKSILLDAFALALGARGDVSLVRQGAKQGQVTAIFSLAGEHQVHELLAEGGIDSDSELVLRRIQAADGRTRAFINDQPVSVQLLRRVGELLVEIHGQHDDRALTDMAAHRRLLDAFGGLSGEAEAVAGLHEAWKDAQRALREQEAHVASVRENADYLSHALEELEALDPRSGEEEALAERRQLMMNAEKIAADLEEARAALEGEGTARARLSAALRKIERRGTEDAPVLEPVAKSLERVLLEINEAQEQIEQAMAAIQFSPAELEAAEDRLFALRALARKHSVTVDDLPALVEKFRSELELLDAGEQKLAELRKAEQEHEAAYRAAAQALSAARREAARRLDAEVMAELPPLKLEKARFMTHIETLGDAEGGPH